MGGTRLAACAIAALTAVVAAGALGPAPAAAQRWTAEARVGHLDFRLAPGGAPATTTMAVGLAAAADDLRFGLFAGVPLGEEDPLWGAVDLRDRSEIDVGPVVLGLETAGQGFVQRYASSIETPGGPFQPPTIGEDITWGWGLSAQALPFVGLRHGPVDVLARAGASFYRSGLGDQTGGRTVGLGDVRVTAAPSPTVAFTAEARHFIEPEASWTFGGVGALLALPGVDLWGTVGQWLDQEVDGTPWSLGLSFRLAERLDLALEGREDVLDPLYGSAPRRAWSVAARVRLAGHDAAPAEPVPDAYDEGVATIAVAADETGESPRIAGDFNDWTPEPLQRQGTRWVWRGSLEPGVYEYAFVNPAGEWFVPASVPGRKEDGMGGWVALLIVEEPAS